MTEKRYKQLWSKTKQCFDIRYPSKVQRQFHDEYWRNNIVNKRFTVDSDGKWWDRKEHKYVTIDYLFGLVEKLDKENEQLKQQVNELSKENIHLDARMMDLQTRLMER